MKIDCIDKIVPHRQTDGQTLAFLELLLEPKILVLNLNIVNEQTNIEFCMTKIDTQYFKV